MDELNIKLFGNITLSVGDKSLDCSANRAKRVWLLIAYLVFKRNKRVSADELIGLLWGRDKE